MPLNEATTYEPPGSHELCLEQLTQSLGIEIRIDLPATEEDTGAIIITATPEMCSRLLTSLGFSGGQYPKGYRSRVQLPADVRQAMQGGTIDFPVTGPTGEMQQIRIMVDQYPDTSGRLIMQLGRGGNYTSLTEMQTLLRKTFKSMVVS